VGQEALPTRVKLPPPRGKETSPMKLTIGTIQRFQAITLRCTSLQIRHKTIRYLSVGQGDTWGVMHYLLRNIAV